MSNRIEKVHFIAIGGSAMHNLALALHHKGFAITGSDDEIFEPSKTRLSNAGILPKEQGWFPEKINKDLDAVILGMHARVENPELLKAQELGLKIYSYPEYIYSQCTDKQRVVIAGSHGKTSITSMILHVLNFYNKKFDYLVGAQLEGFDRMVKLTEDAPIIIIEGDEYLSSPIDRTPKFLHYKHHIGLVSGISWDHINVFPTFDDYVKQFDAFADSTPKGGTLVYCEDDYAAAVICGKEREDVQPIEYNAHRYEVKEGICYLIVGSKRYALQIFGKHNMSNLNGAKKVLEKLGISDEQFYEAIQSFKGAANRLELLSKNNTTNVYKDFAHAPSKLKATSQAVKSQFSDRKLTAVLELHTFSSLNKKFLSEYNETFNAPDESIVYFNPHTVAHKKLEFIGESDILRGFNMPHLKVFTDSQLLQKHLTNTDWKNRNLLLMSSGNFDGLDLKQLSQQITNNN